MSAYNGRVLVYGANGAQGAPVARALIERGTPIRVVTRSAKTAAQWQAAGAEIAEADLNTGAGLAEANRGISAVFLQISASIPPKAILEQARQALLAARDVPQVIMTTSSIIPPHPVGVTTPDERHRLPSLAHEIVPHAVVLSPTLFLENFSQALRPAVMQGVIALPVPGDTPVAYISVEDQARFVLAALDRPAIQGQVYPIAGPEVTTGTELAAKFSEALGRSVHYYEVDAAQFGAQLVPFLGEEVANAIAEMYEYESKEGAFLLNPDLSRTLRDLPVQLTSINSWLASQEWR
jgi:uncharacterized protein YbjT (DUF2867 family)